MSFYYWKQNFQLSKGQSDILAETNGQKLYVRFFDIKWNTKAQKPYPEAIINFRHNSAVPAITPVVFITNQTFEKLSQQGVDSLAIKCNELLKNLALKQKLHYKAVQIDCDWTVGTKDKYFNFLHSFKAHSKKTLEATIRLHQVKYQFKTGVPPVDRGVLMFYNMGKLSADLEEPNSIYNANTAEKYLGSLNNYLLPLDIALPVFSWALQIRANQVIQVYGKIGRAELSNTQNFSPTAQKDLYKAIRNFFTGGIYIKAGDLFKLEETDKALLEQAAVQLAAHLNKNEKRTIIYYELGNLNLSAFKAKDFEEISAYF
ncbi:hypothetical protein [Pedobacter nyackensis]|uniref:Uncharacterized protein n=1 Tax=Pedobacter nyackensis TaxID=475255 RepID=A0A1W2EUJ0_9SPHI|nr:hypothetical protein [Pedobacter nyackensis]SMD13377.1 hypothetical protein SAMN04488101_11679 [Pedobacter nyackensis]